MLFRKLKMRIQIAEKAVKIQERRNKSHRKSLTYKTNPKNYPAITAVVNKTTNSSREPNSVRSKHIEVVSY